MFMSSNLICVKIYMKNTRFIKLCHQIGFVYFH